MGYATLQLESHRNGTDNNQNNDILGEIAFHGYNDNGDRTKYSGFATKSLDVADGDERGEFYFQVMTMVLQLRNIMPELKQPLMSLRVVKNLEF